MRLAIFCAGALLVLAACGVDGAPTPPAPQTGLSISGTASFGLARGGQE